MNRTTLTIIVISVLLAIAVPNLSNADTSGMESDSQAIRFAPVHVYIDSGDAGLAAWQVELTNTTGNAKIVGIEGGEHGAFKEPPYYDSAAMMNERVIIAAFCTGSDLPSGRTRVATLHMQITGEGAAEYEVILKRAAGEEANEITATITIEQGE